MYRLVKDEFFPMKAIKAFVFDWGNTLVDYPLRYPDEQFSFLQGFLSSTVGLESQSSSLKALVEGFSLERADLTVVPFEKRFQERLGGDFPEQNLPLLEQSLCDQLFQRARQFEDALPTLQQLKELGYRIGVVSNTPWGTDPSLWRMELDARGFNEDVVDAAVFCGEVGYRKPHPAIFHHCMALLGVSPKETIFVGDNLQSDMSGARAAGCIPVWLYRKESQEARQSSEHRAFDGLTIETLSQLTDSRFVIH